jgi:hypothetical protein
MTRGENLLKSAGVFGMALSFAAIDCYYYLKALARCYGPDGAPVWIGAAALALILGWAFPPRFYDAAWPGRWAGLAVAAATAGALIAFVMFAGNRQFGGYDYSPLIDVAWRQIHGQRVYADFFCPFPPVYYLAARWAFFFLGATWNSLVILAALSAAALFLWTAGLLRALGKPLLLAIPIALCVQCMTLAMCGFFDHNALTSSMGVIYVLSALWLLRAPASWRCRVSYGLALALLAGLKPGVAAALIASVTLALVIGARKKWLLLVAALSLAAFGLYAGVLAAHGIGVLQVVQSYAQIGGRGLPTLRYMPEVVVTPFLCALVGFAAMAALGGFWSPASRRELMPYVRSRGFAVLVAAGVSGMYGWFVDSEIVLVDFALVVVVVCVFLSAFADATVPAAAMRRVARAGAHASVMVCAGLIVLGLGLAWSRYKVKTIGPFFECETTAETFAVPFLASVRSGPWFHAVVDETDSALRAHAGSKVFFGPRIEFAYAAFGLPSPRGLPIWWHPGTSYPLQADGEISRRFGESRFDLLVFARDDFTRIPEGVLSIIASRYRRMGGYSAVTVFTLR